MNKLTKLGLVLPKIPGSLVSIVDTYTMCFEALMFVKTNTASRTKVDYMTPPPE